MKAYENYLKARGELAQEFGLDDLWHDVIDNREHVWDATDRDIWYSQTITEEDGSISFDEDEEYGLEIYGTSRWESKDGTSVLFVAYDGCGNRDMYLFDADKHNPAV